MTKARRELEKLVEGLERILSAAAADVTIKSPDHIMGRESQELREVDVSVRNRVGSTDVLVIFECRDRRARQNVQWFDELAGKGEDVGANKVVAVSSSGFLGRSSAQGALEGNRAASG